MAGTVAEEYKELLKSQAAVSPSNFSSPYSQQIAQRLYDVDNYAPYQSQYAQDIQDAYSRYRDHGDYPGTNAGTLGELLGKVQSYAPYQDQYKQTIDDLLTGLQNRQFTYDLNTDPLYQQAVRSTLREADRTAEDVLARSSIPTGGRASSYAVAAASQAANQLKSQLTDRQLDFYNAAYQKYYNDYVNQLNLASAYETRRAQDADLYNDEYNRLLSQYDTTKAADDTEYARWQDQGTELYNKLAAAQALDNTDYGRYQDRYSMLLDQLGALTGRYDADYANWSSERTDTYNRLVQAISATGYSPTDAELAMAGMTRDEANKWYNYYTRMLNAASSSGGGGYGGGGGYSSSSQSTPQQQTVSYSYSDIKKDLEAIYKGNGLTGVTDAIRSVQSAGYISNSQASDLLKHFRDLAANAAAAEAAAAQAAANKANTTNIYSKGQVEGTGSAWTQATRSILSSV